MGMKDGQRLAETSFICGICGPFNKIDSQRIQLKMFPVAIHLDPIYHCCYRFTPYKSETDKRISWEGNGLVYQYMKLGHEMKHSVSKVHMQQAESIKKHPMTLIAICPSLSLVYTENVSKFSSHVNDFW